MLNTSPHLERTTDPPRTHLGRYLPTAAVALAAAVVTAHGLVEVARAARVSEPMAWLYPLITDGLALVAYRATSRLGTAGARYAWAVVVVAAGMSGLAQAVYLASDSLLQAPPELRFGVGAWPAIAAAVAAHLLHLLLAADQIDDAPAALPLEGMAEREVVATHPTPDHPGRGDVMAGVLGAETPPARPAPEAQTTPDGIDSRVRELAAELAEGAEITGEQAGQRYGLSTRSGRRLVGQARTHLEAAAPRADPGARPTTTPLHLVTEGTGTA